jgi:hypothetical protein
VDQILEWGKEFLTENKDKTEMKKMSNINPTKSIKEAEVVIRIIDELKIIRKQVSFLNLTNYLSKHKSRLLLFKQTISNVL